MSPGDHSSPPIAISRKADGSGWEVGVAVQRSPSWDRGEAAEANTESEL